MIYKKIDLTQAIMSNIEQEAAEAFIDSRQGGATKFTQRAFKLAVNAAVKCEIMGLCSATDAFDITIEKGWKGVTVEYIANEITRRQSAAFESAAPLRQVASTRNASLEHDLNDTTWAH